MLTHSEMMRVRQSLPGALVSDAVGAEADVLTLPLLEPPRYLAGGASPLTVMTESSKRRIVESADTVIGTACGTPRETTMIETTGRLLRLCTPLMDYMCQYLSNLSPLARASRTCVSETAWRCRANQNIQLQNSVRDWKARMDYVEPVLRHVEQWWGKRRVALATLAEQLEPTDAPVSYTHLTLPTNREV